LALAIDLFLDLTKDVRRDVVGYVLKACWSLEYSSSERYSITSLVKSFVSMKLSIDQLYVFDGLRQCRTMAES
jgi:hypothetical protein